MAVTETTVVRALLSERARLMSCIWVIVRDSSLAEDVYQEVAALAIQKCHELREEAALPTWLLRTARFQALAAIRDRSREKTQTLTPEILDRLDAWWSARDSGSEDPRITLLAHCLSQLSPYAREIVSLRYHMGLSGEKVAERLGRNVRTIYMALTRIHNSLRECIATKLSIDSEGLA